MNILSEVFYYIVPFIIILGVLVFVHEFGHFIVARAFGVKVDEFSIGFGKKICGFVDKKGTIWKICAIPLGGYVKMYGDENAASANTGKAKKMTKAQKKVAFEFQHPLKKIFIVFAGPLFNYIFAALVYASIFFFVGKLFIPTTVGEVMPNSPAFAAGILKGDKILSFNGNDVNTFDDLKNEVALSVIEENKVKVQRDGKVIELIMPLKSMEVCGSNGEIEKRKMIGVISDTKMQTSIEKLGFFAAIKEGVVETYDITALTLRGVGQMISGQRSGEDVGGVIRIAQLSGDVSKNKNFADFFMFMALLSVNLGLINLFPVPILDGGHIVIYAIEAVTRKKVSDKLKEWLAKFGFAIIMALLVFATYNDIIRFFK